MSNYLPYHQYTYKHNIVVLLHELSCVFDRCHLGGKFEIVIRTLQLIFKNCLNCKLYIMKLLLR